MEGETLLAAFIARSWPRLRAESVFFLPNHLPGVDAGSGSEDVPGLSLLRGEGVSCVWWRSKYLTPSRSACCAARGPG